MRSKIFGFKIAGKVTNSLTGKVKVRLDDGTIVHGLLKTERHQNRGYTLVSGRLAKQRAYLDALAGLAGGGLVCPPENYYVPTASEAVAANWARVGKNMRIAFRGIRGDHSTKHSQLSGKRPKGSRQRERVA